MIVLYEVHKWVKRESSEADSLVVTAQIRQTRMVSLTALIALAAGDLSLAHGLAMANALVYATAVHHGIDLVASDAQLSAMAGVLYLPR